MQELWQTIEPSSARPRQDRLSPKPTDFGYAGPVFAVVALLVMAVIIYFRFVA